MPRLKLDPVDVAFRAWKALDADQQVRLFDKIGGYQDAMGETNGTAAPEKKIRTRRPKVEALPKDSIPKTA